MQYWTFTAIDISEYVDRELFNRFHECKNVDSDGVAAVTEFAFARAQESVICQNDVEIETNPIILLSAILSFNTVFVKKFLFTISEAVFKRF